MHLAEILARRSTPGAGVFLSLTRRCPLSCAHCSTDSTLASEQLEAAAFSRFVGSFTADDHPELVALTGGEALLRPRLVADLTEAAHAVGTNVMLLSGMFFARQPAIPPEIDRAIAGLDHFSASIDVYHEQEVDRHAVFRVLHRLLDRGQDVSLHAVGLGADDPYLEDLTGEVRREFCDRVPMLVSGVGPVGRAAEWLPSPKRASPRSEVRADGCPMAAWPVVAFDGTVVACCNQDVVDGPAPDHLRIGHVTTVGWSEVRARSEGDPVLRALRVFGPDYTAANLATVSRRCGGYCSTCQNLQIGPADRQRTATVMDRPAVQLAERALTEALVHLPLRGIIPRYAHLTGLGHRQEEPCAPV